MCGRYTLFTDEEYGDIRKIIDEIERKHGNGCVKVGEIFPTNVAPILLDTGGTISASIARWGFPSFRNANVIINARSETAAEKRMFRKSFMTRRCVVPSTGFFEWDSQKKKHLFRLPGSSSLYMAGLYNDFQGIRRYVILTTAANASVAPIHNRMPVIVPQEWIAGWLTDEHAAFKLMDGVQPLLHNTM